METYQRTVFALVRAMFVLVPVFAVAITIANALDHPLRGEEIGAIAFIMLIGVVGFFATRFIQRIILGDRQ